MLTSVADQSFSPSAPRIAVLQPGSRHRYFIPLLFEQEGMLELLATDFTTHSWIGGFLKKRGVINRPDLSSIPLDKIISADAAVLAQEFVRRLSCRLPNLSDRLRANRAIVSRVRRKGLGSTNVIYSMNVEFAEYLESVRSGGKNIRIVCDLYMHPRTYSILNAACAEFPSWPFRQCSRQDTASMENLVLKTARIADVLLCPSQWVAQGVREVSPHSESKIRICPYGSSIDYNGRHNVPIRGRFFWAGRGILSALCKGLPYLARAAGVLRRRYPDMDFRIAGITDNEIRELPECRDLHFLGRLDSSAMRKEFLSADAVVFPTLTEGMAGVLVEAIACGCPVITTRCAGLDIADGETGVLVPEHDDIALISAIERVYNDRHFRERVAQNTSRGAPQYSTRAWAERLIQVMRDVADNPNA